MTGTTLTKIIQARLDALQRKNNFDPDRGAAQITGRPSLAKDFGAFSELVNLVRKGQLDVRIPYDGAGLNPEENAQALETRKAYIYVASLLEDPTEVKIGRSHTPYTRAAQLQTANAKVIVVKTSLQVGTR